MKSQIINVIVIVILIIFCLLVLQAASRGSWGWAWSRWRSRLCDHVSLRRGICQVGYHCHFRPHFQHHHRNLYGSAWKLTAQVFEWVSGLDKGLGACGVSGGARLRSGHSIRQGQAHKPWWNKICWNKWPIYNVLTRAIEQAMEQVTQAQEKAEEQKAALNKWISDRGLPWGQAFDKFELEISDFRGWKFWCVKGDIWYIKWSQTRGWGGSAKQNLKY